MSRRPFGISLVAAVLFLVTVPIMGHHSVSGEFDNSKPVEFTGGIVKVVEWTNPHIYSQIEVKEADGTVAIYRVEGTAPNVLFRAGWRKESLKPGTVVSFKGIRARNPASANIYGQMTLPDGKIAWQGPAPTY